MRFKNEPVVINNCSSPVSVEYYITVDGTNIKISDIIKNNITSIKIEKDLGDRSVVTISVEYSINHDSYFSDRGNYDAFVPPYLVFPDVNATYTYTIGYNYIDNYNYSLLYISYPFDDQNSKYSQAVGELQKVLDNNSLSVPGLADAELKAREDRIKEGIIKLRDVIKGINYDINSKKLTTIKYGIISPIKLADVTPTVSSMSGGVDGVIKYDLTLHSVLTKEDRSAVQASSTSVFSTGVSRLYTTKRQLMAIFHDRFYLKKKITLADFIALLFGMIKAGDSYTQGTYPITPGAFVEVYSGAPGVTSRQTLSSFPNDTKTATSATELHTSLKNSNISLDFTILESIDFIDLLSIQKNTQSSLRYELNKAYASPSGAKFFETLNSIITTSKQESQASVAPNAQISVNTAYSVNIDKFLSRAASLKDNDLTSYLNLISDSFSIAHAIDNRSANQRFIRFSTGSFPVYEDVYDKSKEITVSKSVPFLDYGGIVIDFKHSVKSAKIKVDKITNKTTVSQAVSDLVSLDMSLDSEAIKKYAKKYNVLSLTEFSKHVVKRAADDPEGFLLDFIKYTSNVKVTNLVNPESLGVGGGSKGNQTLSLTMRHPIPIKEGQLIYFDIRGFKATEKPGLFTVKNAEGQSETVVSNEVGFYPLPDKIRGVYVVVKVTYEFDAKKGFAKMELECER